MLIYDHKLISLKPSKSCNGTYRGDSFSSAFVISCINKINKNKYTLVICCIMLCIHEPKCILPHE